MRAIILAAGQGTRLRPLTDDIPKTMTPLLGHMLAQHQLETLRRAGVAPVAIAGGYRAEKLASLDVPVFVNPDYATTNMVASLVSAAEFLREGRDEGVLVGYGDIVYEPRNLAAVIEAPGDIAVMVDADWRKLWDLRFSDPLSDAETLVLDGDRIVELGRKPEDYSRIQGQFTGLIRIAGNRIEDLLAAYDALPVDARGSMYMTDFLQQLIDDGWDVRAARVSSGWLEVDTVEDHALYEGLAAEGKLQPLFDETAIWG